MPALIKSVDQVLALDFDVYVAGHGQPGTKQDIFVQQEYLNDLRENAKAAINEVNRTEVTQGINESNSVTEAYFNALTKSCTDKMDAKWQDRMEWVGVCTDEHGQRMIISKRVD